MRRSSDRPPSLSATVDRTDKKVCTVAIGVGNAVATVPLFGAVAFSL